MIEIVEEVRGGYSLREALSTFSVLYPTDQEHYNKVQKQQGGRIWTI